VNRQEEDHYQKLRDQGEDFALGKVLKTFENATPAKVGNC